jgi:hypothetical protein
VVAGAPQPRVEPPHLPEYDYELAVLRLRFLTAIPSMDRERSQRWPAAFVDAAVTGLSLSDAHRRLLPKIAVSLRRGTHDPRTAALELAKHGEQDWGRLCARLRDLNDDVAAVAEEVVSLVASLLPHAAPLMAARPTTRPPTPLPPAKARQEKSVPPAPSSEPVAASGANARPLGPLDDLFK